MRAGTPGFIGARLREAREARGMSPQQLAEVLGVSKQAISQYENGVQTPRPELFEKMPAVLNVKHGFFFRAREQDDDSPFFMRSQHAATKQARARARRRQEWLFDVIHFVEQFVELPRVNLPQLDLPNDMTQISSSMIEAASTQLRRYWGLGDGIISDLVLLMENNGIIVARGELWAETLDAFSRNRHDRPFVFLSSEKESAVRSRYDAAHELAHLVLHRHVSASMLARPEIFRKVEDQANYFAGSFLLPANTFADLISHVSLDSLRAHKPVVRVSIASMIMRCTQLGLTDDPAGLWRSYSRRGWRREEPFDQELSPEQPRLLKRAFELLISQAQMSAREIASRFDISPHDIEDLAGLKRGFLSDDANDAVPIRLLALRPKDAAEPPETEKPRAGTYFSYVGNSSIRGRLTMSRKDVHTVPNPKGSGWVNKLGGQEVSRHQRKDTAVERGREIAKDKRSEHVIHNQDGQIARKNSYGNDPNPPKDRNR